MIRNHLSKSFVALVITGMVLFMVSFLALKPTSVRNLTPVLQGGDGPRDLRIDKFMHLPHPQHQHDSRTVDR